MKSALYIALTLVPLASLVWYFRYHIHEAVVRWLQVKQAQLKIRGLRTAISDADADKAETGNKNMVVYNSATGQYEAVRKQLLKRAARVTRNRSNKAHTAGRRSGVGKGRTRILTPGRVHKIEKYSPYVTR